MKVIKNKEQIFAGPESKDFFEWQVEIDGKSFIFNMKMLELLTENEVNEEVLDYLFIKNSVTKNSYRGFNSEEGVSLYYTVKESVLFVFSHGEKQPGLSIINLEGAFEMKKPKSASLSTKLNVSYKKFRLESNPKIIGGSYPQIDNFTDNFKITKDEKKSYTQYYNDFIPDHLNLNEFKLNSQAYSTDFYSSAFLTLNGIFISSKVYEILKNIEIPNVKYYQSALHQKNKNIPTYFMNIKESDIINYKRSFFKIKTNASTLGGQEINFQNSKQHDSKIDELLDSNSDTDIFADKINLSAKPPFFKLYATGQYFISNVLLDEFESQNIIGYFTESQNIFNN